MVLELTLAGLYGLLTIVSVFFAWKLMFAFKHFKMKQLLSEPSMLADLPSVSVCIPARNETDAMTQCLEAVIANTYPKLEIIVLDDNSGDNTSHLIKAFAHSGVRFVEGSPLAEGWLGKNYALQELLDEASGSYVLFMDVDTRIKPDTIEQLVSYAQQEKAAMVSVLPLRADGWRLSVLLGSLRYFWELVAHRRSKPAVASSAWMVNRQLLLDYYNGFKQVSSDVQPEAVLAAGLSKINKYRFLISTRVLGVSYEKKWSSQVDTSIRLLYPLIGGRIGGAIVGITLLLLLNLPAFFVISGLINSWTIIETAALWQLCLFIALYGLYLEKVWNRGWWFGALLWPYVIIQELALLILSISGYTRRAITWKGRPITAAPTSSQVTKN